MVISGVEGCLSNRVVIVQGCKVGLWHLGQAEGVGGAGQRKTVSKDCQLMLLLLLLVLGFRVLGFRV